MSRIAKQPIDIPEGVDVNINNGLISIKGPKGEISMDLSSDINIKKDDDKVNIEFSNDSNAIAGTTRSLIFNNVIGVTKGFEKSLNLVGVGYKAEIKNKILHLNLGFSHPINYEYPDDIEISTPSPTEIIVKGISKQKVGQIAAEIRSFRPPEPYKGKGVKYSDENIIRKEAKKK